MASMLNKKRQQVWCVRSEETLEENGARSEGLKKNIIGDRYVEVIFKRSTSLETIQTYSWT